MEIAKIKSIISKLNSTGTRVLQNAAGTCVSRGHYEVTVEHFLSKCLEEPHSDFCLLLLAAEAYIPKIQTSLLHAMEDFHQGNQSKPTFSPLLMELLQEAWLISSLELHERAIRTGAILLAFARRPLFYAAGPYVDYFAHLPKEELQGNFHRLCEHSAENETQDRSAASPPSNGNVAGTESALARFCHDITAKARAKAIDPVFGRDAEIRQMLDILARRRKNNPILVGDPGVGKTAVVEGLALRIVNGDVPEMLKGVRLLTLDIGLLEAGAGMKGEFEQRLRGVIAEVKASPVPIILFIDEAHTIIGAGGQQGGSDAANLLKPALARGELRTCAATTWSEYKKYFEKDPALARRFQPVTLDEPSVPTTGLILRGLRDSYERDHGVIIRDAAIDAAADLADRYITARFLPDKAIDLLDTACARVKVNLRATPAGLETCKRRINAGRRELEGLERDLEHGLPVNEDKVQTLRSAIADDERAAESLTAAWESQREAADKLFALRRQLREWSEPECAADSPTLGAQSEVPSSPDAPESAAWEEGKREALLPDSGHDESASSGTENPGVSAPEPAPVWESKDALREELLRATAAFELLQRENPLLQVEVNEDLVAQIVSDWTGIPLGKMARQQAGAVLGLRDTLAERIRGQSAALDIICRKIAASKAGLGDPCQPIGVFLLAGPSGTGKTETALALADQLFGDEKSLIAVNMSEFQEKHTVSRLIGSPPGYVGYGEGGLLTEAVRQRPYSVVLLDEIEKAHPDILNLFLQVFSKGELADGESKVINFRNTVCIATSNLGSEALTVAARSGNQNPGAEELVALLRPSLAAHFRPALLSRMTVAPYMPLGVATMKEIVAIRLDRLKRQLHAQSEHLFTYSDDSLEHIAALCTGSDSGARAVEYVLNGTILPHLAEVVLTRDDDSGRKGTISLIKEPEGDLQLLFQNHDTKEVDICAG